MKQPNIRAAAAADVPAILRFIKDLARYEKAEAEVVATEHALHQSLFGRAPCARGLVAEMDGAAAGFALYFFNFSTWQGLPGLYLEDLYVAPGHRGAGVGKALLKRLARIAVEHGCGRFEWSVLDWNEPALKFYESLGARAQSEWVKYRLEGAPLRALADAGAWDDDAGP